MTGSAVPRALAVVILLGVLAANSVLLSGCEGNKPAAALKVQAAAPGGTKGTTVPAPPIAPPTTTAEAQPTPSVDGPAERKLIELAGRQIEALIKAAEPTADPQQREQNELMAKKFESIRHSYYREP